MAVVPPRLKWKGRQKAGERCVASVACSPHSPGPVSQPPSPVFYQISAIMGAASMLTLLLTHPLEFRTLVQYKVWHEPKRDITAPSEHATSGWDRPSMQRCWHFLDQTSRSFSGVIKELNGDLARVVCSYIIF